MGRWKIPTRLSGRQEARLCASNRFRLDPLRQEKWTVLQYTRELLMTKTATHTMAPPVRYDVSLLTPQDLHLFNEGTHYRIYEKLGAHEVTSGGETGTVFGVWPP